MLVDKPHKLKQSFLGSAQHDHFNKLNGFNTRGTTMLSFELNFAAMYSPMLWDCSPSDLTSWKFHVQDLLSEQPEDKGGNTCILVHLLFLAAT